MHGFRQKNMAADRLANIAYTHRCQLEFFRDSDLPRSVRNAFTADKLGLWSLDLRCFCTIFFIFIVRLSGHSFPCIGP